MSDYQTKFQELQDPIADLNAKDQLRSLSAIVDQLRDKLNEVKEKQRRSRSRKKTSSSRKKNSSRKGKKSSRKVSKSHRSRSHHREELDSTFEVLKAKRLEQQSVFDGKVMNYRYHLKPYPLTESTIRYLSKELFNLPRSQIERVNKNNKGGANIFMRPIFTNPDNGQIAASCTIKLSNVKMDKLRDVIHTELSRRSNKLYPTTNYILDLTEVMILVSSFPRKGGCQDNNTCKSKLEVSKDCEVHFTSHKSKNNNCLIQCFNHAYGVSGRELKAAKVRKELKIGAEEMIDMDYVIPMSKWYSKRFKQQRGVALVIKKLDLLKFDHPLYSQEEYKLSEDQDNDMVRICLMNEHYDTYKVVCYRKCDVCGQKTKDISHKCNKNVASYYNTKISKKKDMVKSNKIAEDKIDYESIVHWDTETFQPGGKDGVRHQIYASGFYDRGYKVYYGEEAGEKSINRFLKMENRIINAYNGSGFDYIFLMDELTARRAYIEDMVMNNGRLMAFSYHVGDAKKKNKVFDLYLFTMV
ncbi:MAG: hypothetical protein P4M14_12535 [Gammaproteobacteria bacterium]|nr:hypothetical protein [Gammaproteobacteria bacterium]